MLGIDLVAVCMQSTGLTTLFGTSSKNATRGTPYKEDSGPLTFPCRNSVIGDGPGHASLSYECFLLVYIGSSQPVVREPQVGSWKVFWFSVSHIFCSQLMKSLERFKLCHPYQDRKPDFGFSSQFGIQNETMVCDLAQAAEAWLKDRLRHDSVMKLRDW